MMLPIEKMPAAAEFQFVDRQSWIDGLGISWLLGVDGISLFLVVLTAILFPIAIAAVDAEHSPKAYYAWLLVLETGCMGVFLALDLFAFFVFFEIVLVPMYFLIGQWGHGERAYAATKFFLFTMFGSAFMLVGDRESSDVCETTSTSRSHAPTDLGWLRASWRTPIRDMADACAATILAAGRPPFHHRPRCQRRPPGVPCCVG